MSAFYGFGCGGGSFGSDETIEINVKGSLVKLLKDLQAHGVVLDQDGIVNCIKGSPERPLNRREQHLLMDLHEVLSEKHKRMVIRYWIFEDGNSCEREVLEPFMAQDIKDGVYEHSLALEEFKEEEDTFWLSDDQIQDEYEERLYQDYREWVYGQEEERGLFFIAERVGCEYCSEEPVEYTITLP